MNINTRSNNEFTKKILHDFYRSKELESFTNKIIKSNFENKLKNLLLSIEKSKELYDLNKDIEISFFETIAVYTQEYDDNIQVSVSFNQDGSKVEIDLIFYGYIQNIFDDIIDERFRIFEKDLNQNFIKEKLIKIFAGMKYQEYA